MEWHLLNGVPEEEVRLVLSVARRRRFKSGEVVFHRNDPADSLHLVSSGRFALQVITPLGQTVTIAVRGPGSHFGEMALLDAQDGRSATVIALEDAETFAVYQDDFARLRARHWTLNDAIIGFLAREVRSLNERLIEALYVPVDRRVVRRVVELCDTYAHEGDEVTVPLTQEELAGFAGATRATVNRVLRAEERRGTLRLERGRIVVLDRETLTRSARP